MQGEAGLGRLRAGVGGERHRAVRELADRRARVVGERVLLAHVEEEPPRDAAAEDLVGDLHAVQVSSLRDGTERADVDVALRALRAIGEQDLEALGRQSPRRSVGAALAALPGAERALDRLACSVSASMSPPTTISRSSG